jgi:hypothetical protein
MDGRRAAAERANRSGGSARASHPKVVIGISLAGPYGVARDSAMILS